MVSVPPPTSPLAQPGATIAGKYRLDSLVGYGGMGSVWAATHLGLHHQVAIKLISQDHVRSADVRRRFDTEAKAVARLKSRHVVQIYDNGELEDGTPYIAMELLQGESLHRRIHRAGPMALPEAVLVISQVCRALSRAHAAGIVHRDIKPDNIFLAHSEEDGGYVAKVLDFGVAKLATPGADQSSTQTGSLVGTPLYMSPEQARGLRTIDHRTDLYSLALVTYTMLTGNLAFSGDSFGDLLLKICTQELPSLRAAAPWLPASVDAWFQKAGAREPGARHQSAQEFAESLAVAAGAPLVAPIALAGSDASGGFPSAHALGDSITKPYPQAVPTPVSQASSQPPHVPGPHSGGTMTGATVQAATNIDPPSRRGGAGWVFAVMGVCVLLGGGAAFVHFSGHHDGSAAASSPPVTATATAIPRQEALASPAPPPPEPPLPAAPASAAPSAVEARPPSTKPHDPPKPVTHTPTTKPVTSAGKPTKPHSASVDLGY